MLHPAEKSSHRRQGRHAGLVISENWRLLKRFLNPQKVKKTPSVPRQELCNPPVGGPSLERKYPSAVALDCEMVGAGQHGIDNLLARVSLVDESEELLLDCLVRPKERVTDFRTHITGLEWSDLKNGISYEEACEKVRRMISGKLVVGHALHNDFKVLDMTHPIAYIRDTSTYKPLRPVATIKGTPSLRTLVWHWFGEDIHKGVHNSIKDALFCMKLYLLKRDEWEKRFASMLHRSDDALEKSGLPEDIDTGPIMQGRSQSSLLISDYLPITKLNNLRSSGGVSSTPLVDDGAEFTANQSERRNYAATMHKICDGAGVVSDEKTTMRKAGNLHAYEPLKCNNTTDKAPDSSSKSTHPCDEQAVLSHSCEERNLLRNISKKRKERKHKKTRKALRKKKKKKTPG